MFVKVCLPAVFRSSIWQQGTQHGTPDTATQRATEAEAPATCLDETLTSETDDGGGR
jgi:hypothetical protein